ncbi:MAG TPA: PocR ligand-binding domain-containing protein [Anaerolineales bacterium]|nr:PocR ligand-binding domain-containing protein [Anaerolineales bacterium]
MQDPFSDLVVIPDIQRILDTFQSASGISAEITDMDGQIIAASSSQNMWHEFHPDTLLSRQSNEKSSRRDEPIKGLFQYARAIRLEDREIGTIFLGPVLHAHPDKDTLRQLVQKFGFDETAYLEKLKRVPIVTDEQAQSYVEFLVQLVQRIAEKGFNEIRLVERLAASQEQEAKLQRAYDELAARILQRTEELQRANEALQEGEQRFRVALVDTPIVVFNQDLDLRYTWIHNAQSYADQPVIGKTDADLFSAEDAMRLTALKKRVIATGLLTREEVSVTVGARTNFYDMTLDPLFDAGGAVTGLSCAATDVTERKQLYDQMQRRLSESESIQRIAKGLLQRIGLDEVLQIICAEAMQLTGATGSAVLLLEEDGWLRVTKSAGSPAYSQNRLPVSGSFAGRAFQTGEHVWVNLHGSDPEDAVHQLEAYQWIKGLVSLLVVPLKVDTKVIGILNILNKPGEVTQEDKRIIDLFADQAAIIIEHIRLQDQAEQLAVLEERQRLARELHDSVTQALYSVTLYADAARIAYSAQLWDVLERNLKEVRTMAREAMYDMRLLVFELRPFMLEKEGLVSVLRARLAAVENRAGLKSEVLIEGERRLPISIEEELYRIAQEGLNNVVKHAAAKQVRIHIQYDESSIWLELIDDGLGFDPQTADQSGGFGLQGIQERVQRLGGSLEIESAPMQGTRLRVRVPTGLMKSEPPRRRSR